MTTTNPEGTPAMTTAPAPSKSSRLAWAERALDEVRTEYLKNREAYPLPYCPGLWPASTGRLYVSSERDRKAAVDAGLIVQRRTATGNSAWVPAAEADAYDAALAAWQAHRAEADLRWEALVARLREVAGPATSRDTRSVILSLDQAERLLSLLGK